MSFDPRGADPEFLREYLEEHPLGGDAGAMSSSMDAASTEDHLFAYRWWWRLPMAEPKIPAHTEGPTTRTAGGGAMKIQSSQNRRSAFVLVAVLIVISILSYSAYEFAHWVEIETETAIVQGREAQTRYLAESGLAYIEAIERLRRAGKEVPTLDNNADLFREIGISLAPVDVTSTATSTEEELAGRFSIRCLKEKGSGGTGTRSVVEIPNLATALNPRERGFISTLGGSETRQRSKQLFWYYLDRRRN